MIIFKTLARTAADIHGAVESQNKRKIKSLEGRLDGMLLRSMLDGIRVQDITETEQNLELYKFFHDVLPHAHSSHSQIFQDLWALWETSFKRGGYFVEFGALDGIKHSNTLLLEKQYGWNGIAAEPSPAQWEALKQNRDCYISTDCVMDKTAGPVPFVMASNPVFCRVESIVPNDGHEQAGRRVGETVNVATISLNDLLEKAKAPAFPDYMSVDTEGSELTILQSLDFERWKFRLVSVEHNGTDDEKKLDDLFAGKGYRRKFSTFSFMDAWYVYDNWEQEYRPGIPG